MTMVTILVAGGGIGGLAFACTLLEEKSTQNTHQEAHGTRVVVLERASSAEAMKTQLSHSLSLRADVGGIRAVARLGQEEELRASATGSQGFIVAEVVDRQVRKVLASDEVFSNAGGGIRINRFVLWQALLKRAQALGADVRFGAEVTGLQQIDLKDHRGESGVTSTTQHCVEVTLADGPILRGDVLVAADGVGSVVRRILVPTWTPNFLDTIIVGATVDVDDTDAALPSALRRRHGSVCGRRGTSVFIADEGNNRVLVGLALPTSHTTRCRRDALQHDKALLARALDAATEYGDELQPLIAKALLAPSASVITCRDGMCIPPQGRVVFIGDASHPVSPFAGAGANMALVDAVQLADMLSDALTPHEGFGVPHDIPCVLLQFFEQTAPKWNKVVQRQRSTIQVLHTTSKTGLFLRDTTFAVFRFAVVHPRVSAVTATTTLAALVAGVACGVWRLVRALA
ncbi:hypothetical protein PTSG_09100 [Salpingoeca rosetta]|uniref:FAD-binding domain-containing protein n=1 Tax=Salpingoeca rosetta (strain ATCC 50818 / BSB-021) TaxID=946362 RepID=F2UMQ5_SALR5|nr:uncharacterized protein PTSG_09100 [Salpingoeca rosetta]EGD78404.1 hypothetical protein PTSG_09100 [Salpingoeca rosetta]|eukprot:XP_004989353.1 hypothetical protein PTSG_09100 [Salpingoeca rosetta]